MMSIPKKQLHDLIDQLPDDKTGEVINYLKKYINLDSKKTDKTDWNPEEFIGILDNLSINVEEECQKMREEWDHRGWDAISN